jgi:hypothetical protein
MLKLHGTSFPTPHAPGRYTPQRMNVVREGLDASKAQIACRVDAALVDLSLENEKTLIQDRAHETKAKIKLFLKLLNRWIYHLNIVNAISHAYYGLVDKAKYHK